MSIRWTFLCWATIPCAAWIAGISAVSRPTAITLDNNGYKGVLVAIGPDVPQDATLVDKLKPPSPETTTPALWPSGKTLAQRSGGAGFDPRPSQTRDFKTGISS
ncbi:calcium-activated chloride channel regulator 1 [Elysia marginata]|uniref:Calcium-activated chloride channel regulator 1 n=1 Tax=Elysia marginata TaxID=1093978 RepID=A0AAV4EB87_9GAST|nr:calcium-activated chloride channel regulator 1 [Elysia marginata]